ncbi:MAG: M43 family zinc metalloprotease [Bacteroidia bacterium]
MKLKIIILLLISVIGSQLYTQTRPFGRHCLTPQREAHYKEVNPFVESQAEFEAWIGRLMAERPSTSRAIYTIPVIVHVIHEGESAGNGRNIPASRVQSQLDVLNEDFRRMAGTPGFNNHPVGADCEIEFCLAEVDPDGNSLAEFGINRVDANGLNLNDPPYSETYIDRFIKPVTIWDPYRYCNIWVTDIEGSPLTLGFARFPTSSGITVPRPYGTDETDGVVIDQDFFGRDGSLPDARYNKGRSCTHEMGHWLGLVHIWGDTNDCIATDYCDDTPTANSSHDGCPSSATSCGSVDMYENYMDYSDDGCMNVFTNCQKLRMRTVLENSPRRMELLNSDVCSAFMEAPVAGFSSVKRQGCPSLIVEFQDTSLNRPSGWKWSFPGGQPASSTERNPRVEYRRRGAYSVSLTVTNDFGEDSIFSESYVVVRSSSSPSFFFYEDFEDGLGEWQVENPDNIVGWDILDNIGGSRNDEKAVWLAYANYENKGARDRLISPLISFRGKESIRLEFDHAYRAVGTAFIDSFYVRLSTDNGKTFPHTLVSLAETGQRTFATNGPITSSFFPVRDADWCYEGIDWTFCNEINLNEYEGESEVRIMFEGVNQNGNNIYLDNIRLSASCAGETPALFDLFPNPPAKGIREVNLGFFEEEAIEVEVDLFDLTGRKLLKTTLQVRTGYTTHPLEFPTLQPGTYIVRVKKGEETSARKMVVW